MAAGEAGEPEPPGPSRLFAGVTFWVNPSLGLAGYTALAQLLVAHGAEPVTPLPATPLELVRARAFDVDPARVTHVVTPDLDFPSQPSLCALPQPPALVTPAWVHAAVANGFLHRPEYYSPDPANFFSGVVVTTTGGITARDRDLLFAAVEAKGGQFRHNLTKDTTHLVTLMPSGKKYEVALSRPEFGIKVVLPQYFDDCVKLKRRLSENLYQWPEPKILDADGIAGLEIREEAGTFQRIPQGVRAPLNPAITDDTDLMPSTRFLADLTFCIPPSLPRIWTDKLTKAGAKVVHNYAPDVDCVVSLDRAGPTWAKVRKLTDLAGMFGFRPF